MQSLFLHIKIQCCELLYIKYKMLQFLINKNIIRLCYVQQRLLDLSEVDISPTLTLSVYKEIELVDKQ